MVRSLLQERFALAVHREPRRLDVDVLSTVDATRLGPARPCTQDVTGRNACEMRLGFWRVVAVAATVDELAAGLTTLTQRIVLNDSGLSERFQFTLAFTPDAVSLLTPEDAAKAFPQVDRTLPSLRTALREQLGLALSSTQRVVEVLVVDHVARPSPN